MSPFLANPSKPDLRVRVPFEQTLGCGIVVRVNLIGVRFNVYGDELIIIVGADSGSNNAIVNIVSAAGELFTAVTSLMGSHKLSPCRSAVSEWNAVQDTGIHEAEQYCSPSQPE
jgi:hypothetical protein